MKKEPFYKSVKKTLGVIGFFLYWIVQIPAIARDPNTIISLTPLNLGLVLGLLGIKSFTGVMAKKNDKPEM